MPDVITKLVRQLALVLVAASLVSFQAAKAVGESVADGPPEILGALAYDPQTDILYKSDGRAIYTSDNGGERWEKVALDRSSDEGRIAAVAVSAGGQEIYIAGPGLGVLKSADAGKSWAAVDQELPNGDVLALTTHSTLPETVYAVLAGDGIYRSEDGGTSWRMVDQGPEAPVRQIIHVNMEGSMQTGFLIAATAKGVYRAMDCFCGWRIAGNSPEAVTAVAFNPIQPAELYATSGQQIFRTENGGEDWERAGSPGDDVEALAHSRSGVLYALLSGDEVVHSTGQGRQWQ